MNHNDTIIAISTPPGMGAIAVLRISGQNTFKYIREVFKPKKKSANFDDLKAYTLTYGEIVYRDEVIDEVMLSIYKSPNSYTGEDIAEISCHGSVYIQQRLMQMFSEMGVRIAEAGEFSMRAFMNGKMDLSQAEAVADIISSSSKTAHKLAMKQMRGGFSQKIAELREQLLEFSSLIELELDFSEEDVEFADRERLNLLLDDLDTEVSGLLGSFKMGNVIRKGVPVAIIGAPNAGKSTLLNALLNEERAIVSDIPGTTRDSIEDTIVINGTTFRFIDTAGLREGEDEIEVIGIERTYDMISKAAVILYVFDIRRRTMESIKEDMAEFCRTVKDKLGEEEVDAKHIILVGNKIDQLIEVPKNFSDFVEMETVFVSAKRKENLTAITDSLLKSVDFSQLEEQIVVTNARHFEALSRSKESIDQIREAMLSGIPSDLIAVDIRNALHFLGEITGHITTDEILGSIFSKFCIGK